MARRQHLTLMVILVIVAFFSISWLFSTPDHQQTYHLRDASAEPPAQAAAPVPESPQNLVKDTVSGGELAGIDSRILTGGSIAPKLENATAKAELGRASWRLFHTMMARFPEEPSADDSLALKTYIHLFARLYPCGDCASHFQTLLEKYPPQTSSRQAAAGWACFVHNEVNERLEKEIFDCNAIGDFYDCGCGEEGKEKGEGGESELESKS